MSTYLQNPDAELRIIFHIDLNSFFASVEQQANPFIRGKPVAVAHKDYPGSAVLAASYPAKKFGVGLSTRLWEAKQLCPDLIVVPLDHLKYYSVHGEIMKILREETPLVEVYSIDEAFMDVTDIVPNLQEGVKLAQKIKDRIQAEVGECFTSSVGVSHNKLLAKLGSNFKKPDGLTVIPWESRFDYIDKFELGKIWGIGRNCTPKLEKIGVTSTKELREIDDMTLRGLVGGYYTRLKMIAHGEHFDPVTPSRAARAQKTMQHAHTFGKVVTDKAKLLQLIRKQSERLARRLRRHHQQARIVSLGLRPAKQIHYGWGYFPQHFADIHLSEYTNNGYTIYTAAKELFQKIYPENTPIRLAVVGLADLQTDDYQPFSIFQDPKIRHLDSVTDSINDRFGEFVIRTGDILYEKAKETELSSMRSYMTFHPD